MALALRVKSIDLYDKFISGEGELIIRSLFESDSALERLSATGKTEANPIDLAVNTYINVINGKLTGDNRDDYSAKEANEFIKSILPLMGSISDIDPEEKSNNR